MPAPTSSISAWAIPICRRRAHVIEKIKETIGKPRTDRYSSSRGIPGLRRAQAAYYARRFGVKLNPETQIVATLGSKEGFANVAQAITAPGDVDPRAQSELSDPRFRLSDGRRRDPLGAVRADAGFLRDAWSARSCTPSRSRSRSSSAIRPIPPPMWPISISTRSWSRSRRSTASSCSPILLMRKSISTTIRRLRCCRCRARSMSRSNSPRCRRPIPCRAGAWALRSATSASSRRSARVKSYLDYGAFTPVQVAATAALNGPDDCIREMRETYKRRRDVLVEIVRPRGLGDSSAARLHVRLGADSRAVPDPRQRRVLHAPGREGRGRGFARHRLWRIWRGIRAHRTGRERAAHPPGRPQHPPLS